MFALLCYASVLLSSVNGSHSLWRFFWTNFTGSFRLYLGSCQWSL